MSVEFYIKSSYKVSKLITKQYSTSFSLATSVLEKDKRDAIYAIYGFVRIADEIVDSFQGFDKPYLLQNLTVQLDYALENGISSNVILTSFADTVKKYKIAKEHINAFMESMRNDLTKTDYTTTDDLNNYIYGSADVVGLMCLKVFCNGNQTLYNELEYAAQKLGSAFQKVNFLRDLKNDKTELGRSYFPGLSANELDETNKKIIEQSIEKDFNEAWSGIKRLPGRSKLAVALAYYYYLALLEKIKHSSPERLLTERVRISDLQKYFILLKVGIKYIMKLF